MSSLRQPETELEVLEWLDWIPFKRYLEISQESKEALRKRMRSGAWKRGEQWSVPEGADIWISISGVKKWAAADSTLAVEPVESGQGSPG